MRLRLLDLDGSLLELPTLARRAELAQVLDMRDLGEPLRLWATAAALEDFRRRLEEAPPLQGIGPEITFLGSGDYHHLAAVLIGRAAGPLSVIHFDNHPDWVRLPPAWHCGSWVNRVLDMPHVARVVTIGPCSDDLTWPQLKGANLAALASGRLELWPWRHAPSRRLGAPPLAWRNLGDETDWAGCLAAIFGSLPTRSVWVSIDKDVLRPEEAITNWDQGEMPLSVLTRALRILARKKSILGIDVCGEYSSPRFVSFWKRLSAWFDHPSSDRVRQPLWRNDATNHSLLQTFAEIAW